MAHRTPVARAKGPGSLHGVSRESALLDPMAAAESSDPDAPSIEQPRAAPAPRTPMSDKQIERLKKRAGSSPMPPSGPSQEDPSASKDK